MKSPSDVEPRRAARAALTVAVTLFLAGAACIGIVSPAHAQTLRVQKPFSITIGGRASTGGLHHSFNSAQPFDNFRTYYFYAGVSYAFAKAGQSTNSLNPAAGYRLYQVYVDYAARREYFSYAASGNGGGGGNPDERSVGIGPAVAFHLGSQTASVHPFVGLGAGYYHIKNYETSGASRFGGKIFAGFQLKCGFLGELDYTRIGEVNGVDTGGLGTRLGYRF